MAHRCGTVAFLGEPNAGKSSLLNALVGYAVAITAPMAGTTRHALRGVLNTPEAQVIFIDTPGMHRAKNLLERQMNREISVAVKSADVICFVLDVHRVKGAVLTKLANYADFGVPVVLALTKIDSANPDKIMQALDTLKSFTFIKEFVPVSVHQQKGLGALVQSVIKYLPEGDSIYTADIYTDSSERTMAAEIIREAVINRVHEEVPAGVNVVITKFENAGHTTTIAADIICDKQNHKKIIIGSGGKQIHAIGKAARKKLETLLGHHVDLHTFVIVRPGWRDQAQMLQA